MGFNYEICIILLDFIHISNIGEIYSCDMFKYEAIFLFVLHSFGEEAPCVTH